MAPGVPRRPRLGDAADERHQSRALGGVAEHGVHVERRERRRGGSRVRAAGRRSRGRRAAGATSWNAARTPPASGNMITAGHGPAPSGVCRLASQRAVGGGDRDVALGHRGLLVGRQMLAAAIRPTSHGGAGSAASWRREGQRHRHRRALAHDAVDADRPAVGGDGGVGDRHAEPAAAAVAGPRRVGAVEALRHLGGDVRRHARPVVGHGEARRPVAGVDAQLDRRARRACARGRCRRRWRSPGAGGPRRPPRRRAGAGSSVVIGRPGSTAAASRAASSTSTARSTGRRSSGRPSSSLARFSRSSTRRAMRTASCSVRRIASSSASPSRQPADAVQLGVAADRRHRRAQLVRRVGDEAAQPVLGRGLLVERLVEPLEHVVEGAAELAGLGRRRQLGHPLRCGRRRRCARRSSVICLIGRMPRRTTHHVDRAEHGDDDRRGERPRRAPAGRRCRRRRSAAWAMTPSSPSSRRRATTR